MSRTGRANGLATRLLRKGHPDQALRVLLLSFANDPKDPGTLLLISKAQTALAQQPPSWMNTDAVAAARSALTMNPDDPDMWRHLANVYLGIHAQPEARSAVRRAQRLDPTNWRANVAVVAIDAHTRAVTRSTRAALDAALRQAPTEPAVYFAAAEMATARDRPRAALAHYRRVLELDPGNTAALNNVAVIRLGQGRLGETAGTFVGILAQDPTSTLAFANLRVVARLVLILVDLGLLTLISIAFIPLTSSESLNLPPGAIQWVPRATALLAVVFILLYVLWIRSRAGVYFKRFTLSIPAVDKQLTVFAGILALVVLALIVAAFTRYPTTRHIYEGSIGVLVLLFVFILLVANFRRIRR